MPAPLKICLDASIPSMYFDTSELWMQHQTRAFWERLPEYEVYISTIALIEINDTRDAHLREQLLNLISDFTELDSTSTEIQELAEEYLRQEIFATRYLRDAIHVATATVHHIPILVSWNFQHLADVKQMLKINSLNLEWGYRFLLILPPPML